MKDCSVIEQWVTGYMRAFHSPPRHAPEYFGYLQVETNTGVNQSSFGCEVWTVPDLNEIISISEEQTTIHLTLNSWFLSSILFCVSFQDKQVHHLSPFRTLSTKTVRLHCTVSSLVETFCFFYQCHICDIILDYSGDNLVFIYQCQT